MVITQAEKETVFALQCALIAAENRVAEMRLGLTSAIADRDACQVNLTRFWDQQPSSDVPAPKRKYERKSKANHAPALELLNSARNAAEDTQR